MRRLRRSPHASLATSVGEVRLDNAPSVTFLNLHTHPTSRSVRVAQILQLIDFTLFRSSRANLLPLVLTGDLNAEPKSLEIELLRNVLLLRDGYLDANGGSYGASCTYCRANDLSWTFGNRVIDFTLYRSSPDIELSAHQSEINLQGNGKFGPLSDHFGVRTQLNWKVRTPVLLASDSPELKERLDLARRTLQKANAVLVKDGSPAMLKAAGLASRLIRRLSETLPMSVDRLYRLK